MEEVIKILKIFLSGWLLLFTACSAAPSIPEEAKNYPETLVRVEAKMFSWQITHAGADGQLDTADDIKTENLMVVPEHHRLNLILSSQDVIHGFFVPSFGIRQTLFPQKILKQEIVLMEPGQYRFACAEVCGLGHGKMLGFLEVLEEAKYREWLAKSAGKGLGTVSLTHP